MNKSLIDVLPGEEAVFQCGRAAVTLRIEFPDGTTISMPMGPNAEVIYRRGSTPPPKFIIDPPESSGWGPQLVKE